MRKMVAVKMAAAVGIGLGMVLFAAGAAVAQGDLPAHPHLRLVASAPRAGGGQLAPVEPPEGMGEGAQTANANGSNIKDDLFGGTQVFAKNATGINEITMDPDTLNLVDGRDGHRAHNMVLNVVRTYTYDKPGMYDMAQVDAIRNKLNSGDWHCSVHMRDLKNGTSTDVCAKRRTDGMKESAIITVEPKQLTFIHTIRRAGGPGESEMSILPMYGMSGLPAMAMLDPEVFMNLQMLTNGLPGMTGLMDGGPGMIRIMPRIDSEEMARRMAEAKKHLGDAKKHMKDFDSPEMQKQMKDFDIEIRKFDLPETNNDSKELKQRPPAPKAPEAPKGAPSPAPAAPPQ